MIIDSVGIFSRLASAEGGGVKAFTFAFINYYNASIKKNDNLDALRDKALKAYDSARSNLVEKFGIDDEFIKYFDKELGLIDSQLFDDKIFEKVKKVQRNGKSVTVSFEDGGVVGLVDNNVSINFIGTVQARDFGKEFMACGNKAEFCEYLMNKKSGELGISSVRNIDVDEYSSYKEYLLDDGRNIKINSSGVLVDDEYLCFNDFLNKNKDRLSEDAYFEFNKYCVKQDTGERLINPFNLDANDINIDDIVTALSGINRFAGQTKILQMGGGDDFYTVGQHTLSMYYAIKNHPEKVGLEGVSQAYRDKMAKQAALHEAFEGITGTDLISPFKYATKKNEYKIAENDAEAVMKKIFGMALMTPELKKIDKSLAATERYYLVGRGNVDWNGDDEIYDESLLMTRMSQVDVKNELKMIFEKEGLNKLLEDYRFYYNKNLGNDLIFGKKLERYVRELDGFGLRDKDVLLLAKLRETGISTCDSGVEIVIDNGGVIKIDNNGAKVVRPNGDVSVIDLDDFMIDFMIDDIVKLDYEKRAGSRVDNVKSGVCRGFSPSSSVKKLN